MALAAEKGVFTANTSDGNQTVNLIDTGFGTPKALMLWCTLETAEADTGASGLFSCGFAADRSGTASQWCVTTFGLDGNTTSAAAGGQSAASVVHLVSATGSPPTVTADAAFVEFTDAAFTINWTNAPASAIKVHYFAIGGSDVTDALVGTATVSSTAGTQDFTVATGFGKPDLLLATAAIQGGTSDGDSNSGQIFAFGVGKDDSNEQHTAYIMENGRPDMELAARQESTFHALLSSDTVTSHNLELSAKASWPTDGFQVNKVTAPAGNQRIGYLALRGSFTSVIGTGLVPITAPTVNQDLSVGTTPRGAIFFHNVLPATSGMDNTHADLGLFGLGAMDGTREGWVGIGDDDGNANSVQHRHHSESKAIKMFTPSASGTLTSAADSSFSGTNVRLSWADTDTVERQYCYLLFGDSSATNVTVTAAVASSTAAAGAPPKPRPENPFAEINLRM